MPGERRIGWLVAIALLLLGLIALAIGLVPTLARRALDDTARRRGLIAHYDPLRLGWGPSLQLTHLTLEQISSGETVLSADSLGLRVAPGSLLLLHPRLAEAWLSHAQIRFASRATSEPDTLAPMEELEPRPARRGRGARREREDRSGRLRQAAAEMVRLLLLPARSLPHIRLDDVTAIRTAADDTLTVHLDRLELEPLAGGVRLDGHGSLRFDQPIPFDARLEYGRDDRLTGVCHFVIPGNDEVTRRPSGESWPLDLEVDARVHQDRRHGTLVVADDSWFRIGELKLRTAATLRRDGPALEITLAADSLTGGRLQRSLPPPVMGRLDEVATRGSWDYRLRLDLDLARPDSVDFDADVIPHQLSLDPARTRLDILGLDRPFLATIHLPRGRFTSRELSPANPHFRFLDEIDPLLVSAVVTNEDGGFFRHGGFNTEAVKSSIAENIRAGAFRRGAGTITMQLARNLWLGHARTLSRKAQEVMLAWTLEHLTGLGKERLLEIYLNIIEWGPDVHGADEAARFYFGRGANRLSVDEALFLAILVPSPSKWRWRLDDQGELRPFARAQMHFIGRAMIAKGWLQPDQLPPADELRVRLRGPAFDLMFPSDSAATSAGAGPRPGGDVTIRAASSQRHGPE